MNDKDDKTFKPDAVPIHESPDGVRAYREEDLTDAARERFEKLRQSPEFQRKFRGASEAPTWEYAVSDRDLPEKADAAIVRFPGATPKSVLVFSASALNDRLVALARIALSYTRSVQPKMQSQQIALIWSDGTLKVGVTVTKLDNLTLSEQGETEKFRARSGALRQIDGLGRVRIIGSAEDF